MQLFRQGIALFFLIFFASPVHAAITLEISNPTFDGDHFVIDAKVTGLASNSSCFVQGMLTAPDKNKYFGYTFNARGDWQQYISSPSPDTVKNDFISLVNDQTRQIYIKNDPQDPDYKGPGSYLLKLKRYTGSSASGSSAGESNELTVTISDTTPTPTQTSIPTSSFSPTRAPTSTPTSAPPRTPTPTSTTTTMPKSSAATKFVAALTPEVLSASTSASPSAEVATPSAFFTTTSTPPPLSEPINSKQSTYPPLFLILTGLTLFTFSALMIFLHLRSRGFTFAKITRYD